MTMAEAWGAAWIHKAGRTESQLHPRRLWDSPACLFLSRGPQPPSSYLDLGSPRLCGAPSCLPEALQHPFPASPRSCCAPSPRWQRHLLAAQRYFCLFFVWIWLIPP